LLIRRILLIFILLSFWSYSGAQTTLESIKKGEEGDKSWAILRFSESTPWLGISQVRENLVSFYFEARAGNLEGRVSLSSYHPREITITQIKDNPPLLKMDIQQEAGVPFSVLKKNGHVVVAINDESLTERTLAVAEIGSSNPGRLVNVGTIENEDKILTTFHFNGSYTLSGYIRPSNESVTLIIQDTRLAVSENVYTYDESNLKSIQFVEKGSSLKADLVFDGMQPFSVAPRPQRLLVQLDNIRRQQQVAVSQEEKDTPTESVDGTETDSAKDLAVVEEEGKPATDQVEVKETPSADVLPQEALDANSSYGVGYSGIPVGSTIPWDEKFNFRFSSTPIKETLRMIAVAHDFNLVIQDGGEAANITMNLKDVTLKQAMDKILHTHDYEYYEEDGIVTVQSLSAKFKGGSYTKLFRLRYADAENVAKVIKQVVSNDSLVQVFYPEFLQFESAGKNRRDAGPVAVQGIRRSSTLVVTDRPEKIREVTQIIKDLDCPPVQFIIHSKLIEAAPENSSQLGINWDKTITAALWSTNTDPSGGMEEFSADNANPGKGGELLLGHLTASKFQAVLDFLKEKTDSKLKSNPSIMAMDNEESSISVGTTVPVPMIRRGLGGQGDMVTFEYKEVNIQLNVMPHLAENGEITMYVNPIIEEITDWVQYEEHRAPITAKRAVNAIVTVKHGETVVIGGLIKTQKVRTLQKVWLLGSIPLIGKLFQHEKTEERQTDLMIFITPTIISKR